MRIGLRHAATVSQALSSFSGSSLLHLQNLPSPGGPWLPAGSGKGRCCHMGVRRLTRFLKRIGSRGEPETLREGDTLLVDGSGWAFSLLGPGARMDHGGDYDAIDAAARQQVESFRERGIKLRTFKDGLGGGGTPVLKAATSGSRRASIINGYAGLRNQTLTGSTSDEYQDTAEVDEDGPDARSGRTGPDYYVAQARSRDGRVKMRIPKPRLLSQQLYATLHDLDVEVVSCAGEADQQLARECAADPTGRTFVWGSDSDFYLFRGCRFVLFDSCRFVTGGVETEVWTRAHVARLVKMSESQLVEWAMLMGNDYTRLLDSVVLRDVPQMMIKRQRAPMETCWWMRSRGFDYRLRVDYGQTLAGGKSSLAEADGIAMALDFSRALYDLRPLDGFVENWRPPRTPWFSVGRWQPCPQGAERGEVEKQIKGGGDAGDMPGVDDHVCSSIGSGAGEALGVDNESRCSEADMWRAIDTSFVYPSADEPHEDEAGDATGERNRWRRVPGVTGPSPSSELGQKGVRQAELERQHIVAKADSNDGYQGADAIEAFDLKGEVATPSPGLVVAPSPAHGCGTAGGLSVPTSSVPDSTAIGSHELSGVSNISVAPDLSNDRFDGAAGGSIVPEHEEGHALKSIGLTAEQGCTAEQGEEKRRRIPACLGDARLAEKVMDRPWGALALQALQLTAETAAIRGDADADSDLAMDEAQTLAIWGCALGKRAALPEEAELSWRDILIAVTYQGNLWKLYRDYRTCNQDRQPPMPLAHFHGPTFHAIVRDCRRRVAIAKRKSECDRDRNLDDGDPGPVAAEEAGVMPTYSGASPRSERDDGKRPSRNTKSPPAPPEETGQDHRSSTPPAAAASSLVPMPLHISLAVPSDEPVPNSARRPEFTVALKR